jgi:hypothetical protein
LESQAATGITLRVSRSFPSSVLDWRLHALLVERWSPSDAVGDDPHEPVDSAASASPGLCGSSAADGL